MCLLVCLPAHAAEKPWTEVRSPHFRVITDGSDKDARRVAREFEQMRGALGNIFPGIRLDPAAPFLVLAPRDEESMKTLAPWFWKRKGAKPAGYFRHGWDKEFAVVRLDLVQPGAYEVVYHEYVHSVMHLNLRWLPTWLDEGLADFYANTHFEAKHMVIGLPSRRLALVRGQALIPLDTLLAVNPAAPYYHDEDKIGRFYAESWALTHYLTFGEGMGTGKKILEFANLLQQGGNQKKDFEQMFGNLKQVQDNLEKYLLRPTMYTGILKNPPHADEGDFTTRKLTPAETEAELASFYLWHHDLAKARLLAEQALKDDPKLGAAHEDMGFIDFTEGKDEDAAREFSQAIEFDDKLYLSLFSLTMLSPPPSQAAFEDALRKTVALNPQFAPAYVQLVRLYLREGDLTQALAAAQKAENLEPARAGYHILKGQVLLRMGHGEQAALFAEYVASRWTNPDHDEAVELWNSVPVAQRSSSDLEFARVPEGSRSVEGKVKSANCGSKDEGMIIVLDHDGQELRFIAKGAYREGFSDTLWWGEDHFIPCRHVQGLRAVVRYKPSPDSAYAGELAEYYVRDDLPPPPPAKAEESKPGAKP